MRPVLLVTVDVIHVSKNEKAIKFKLISIVTPASIMLMFKNEPVNVSKLQKEKLSFLDLIQNTILL